MPTTATPRNTLKIKFKKVTTAYIAKKTLTDDYSGETHEYTFKSDGNRTHNKERKEHIAKIIFDNETKKGNLNTTDKRTTIAEIVSLLTKDRYNKGDCINISLLKSKVKFTHVNQANLGDDICIVVKTKNLQGREVKMNLKQRESKVFAEPEKAIVVTQNNTDVKQIIATVGEFAKNESITNANEFKDWAIAEIKLSPKNDKLKKDYTKALNDSDLKSTKLYILIDAEIEKHDNWVEVIYEEVFDGIANVWLKDDENCFEVVNENSNVYEIYLDKNNFSKTRNIKSSQDYLFKIIDNNKLIKSYLLKSNKFNLLNFPEKGKNWDRYGSRDKGGDNWINEDAAAGFFGFLHTLEKEGIKEKVYYNDISANDKRNIGHKTHKTGHDIDIRYPGADNSVGQKLWSVSKDYYGSESRFVDALEKILKISIEWGFQKKYNYAFKKDIEHTSGKATSVHQDHYHIGFKR